MADNTTVLCESAVISAFRSAAEQVPAYRQILQRAGVSPGDVKDIDDFQRLVPVIDKEATFGTFRLGDLCRGGAPGPLTEVLTSSGHTGRFAYGLYGPEDAEAAAERIDAALDALFGVRSRPTLLVNCAPMGVRIHTRCCTLADTSVRADMVTAIVSGLGDSYEQTILAGDAAFLKQVLELGCDQGLDWPKRLVHLIVGGEPLAENARTYLAGILGIDPGDPSTGLVGSTMGVAEIGLNLFFEVPQLVALRRTVHTNASLRQMVLGSEATCVPMLFVYDPQRIFVETVDDRRLVISTLAPGRRLPLIRYATGDVAEFLTVPEALRPMAAGAGLLPDVPVLVFHGRGQFARGGEGRVSPEQVKEGLYHDPSLARLTTANFRLHSGADEALVRVQLSPGNKPTPELAERYQEALSAYVRCALRVQCEAYETFGDGMGLDYEHKFPYVQPE